MAKATNEQQPQQQAPQPAAADSGGQEPQQQAGQISALSPGQQLNARRLMIKDQLIRRTDSLAELLPKQIPVKKYIGVIMTACMENTNLLNCTPASLISCAIKAAQMGLIPDPLLGEAYLIPFRNGKKNNVLEAQFIPGYRGLVQLAIRSGQVKRFQSRAVFEADEFEYSFGTEEYIKHKPKAMSQNITHVYAVIEFTNGGLMFDVMTKAEVDAIRDESPNWKNTDANKRAFTIWGTNYPEMAKKTVIRRLSKYAPVSPEFQLAIGLDEKVEVLGESQIVEADDAEWEELSPEEQEKHMLELLQRDKERKDALSTGGKRSTTERANQMLQATENLVNK